MLEFCKNTIKNIEFIYVQKDRLKETREFLDSRFEIIKSPMPGTRTFHEFSPISECKVAVKRCSEGKEFTLVHDFINKSKISHNYTVLQYVACVYEMKWWIGMIYKDQDDARINCMHPHSPSQSFHWPRVDVLDPNHPFTVLH